MQHFRDLPVPERKVPCVPPPAGYGVSPVLCAVCHCEISTRTHGYTRNTSGRMEPCPACSPVVIAHREKERLRLSVEKLFGGADIPCDAQQWSFETAPAGIDEAALETTFLFVEQHLYAEQHLKRGLWLFGNTGGGKTGLAISVLHRAIMEGEQTALYVSIPSFFLRLRGSRFRIDMEDDREQDLLETVIKTRWLVLDELGMETRSQELVTLYQIITERLQRGLYTVFTSNFSLDGLLDSWRGIGGQRLVERLREYCKEVPVRGHNLRI